jgi:hypothetical protein
MDEFDRQQLEQMDTSWLLSNGWTIPGNLAYRRILKEYRETGVLQKERIEQILRQYQLDNSQFLKIQQSLQEFIALKQEFNNLSK